SRHPVRVHTNLKPEVTKLIREIEEQMNRKVREKSAHTGTPVGVIESENEANDRVYQRLLSGIKRLKNNMMLIITSPSKDHMTAVSSMLKILIRDREMGGVYISISRPHEYIVNAMSMENIESDDVYFVDCISKLGGRMDSKDGENTVFVENPSSLEEVSMYLDRLLPKVKSANKFVFLDSIDSLLIYNNEKYVKEFTHYLINKVRLSGIAGIVFSIEKKEAEDLIKTLLPMCDSQIKLE
ncbi:MAG: hypothetical protein NTU61_06575, partial [Candidatus Altiarchaeota archaeon]|nr:hypothetical protein [Candidatus Altiarchaeota archaeon]